MKKIISSITILTIFSVAFQENVYAQNTLDVHAKNLDSIPTELITANTSGIDFSNNRFTKLPIGVFPSVRSLNLSETNISPLELTKIAYAFPNVEEINLSKNSWMVLSNDILAFKKLRSIDLSNNYFTSIPSVFYSLAQLESINLASNDLQYAVENLGYLWKIKEIDVRNNPNIPMEAFLGTLENHDSLRSLAITMNGEKEVFKSLNTFPLTSLTIENSDPKMVSSVVFPKTLTKLQLVNIDLSNVNLRSDAFPNVKEMKFEDSFVSPSLAEFKKLKKVTTNTVIDPLIGKMKHLDSLFLTKESVATEELQEIQTQLPKTVLIYNNNVLSTNEMKGNNLVPFMEKSTQIAVFPASNSQQLKVENLDFSIPKNAFLDANGNVYNGNVTFSVNPIMDATEMALLGSPMFASIGNEEGLFSSAGMFEVKAEGENKQELKPNPAALIEVNMPLIQQNEAAKMYIYSEEKKNWEEMSPSDSLPLNKQQAQPVANNFQLDKQRIIDSLVKSNAFRYQSNENGRRNMYDFHIYTNTEKKSKTNIPSMEISFTKTITTPKKSNLDISGAFISNQKWKIDTLISPAMKYQLKWISKESKKINNKFNRVIRDIQLTPELENDHYRMKFFYKDSIVSLPVLPVFTRDLSEKTAKFDKTLLKLEAKEKIALDSLRASDERKSIQMEKDRYNLIVQYVNQNQSYLYEQEFRKSIGLSAFGMVNCDFFLRNKPNKFVTIPSILISEEGKEIPILGTARVILPAFNTYVEVAREQIPVYNGKPAAAIFPISALEIAVVVIANNREKELKKAHIIDLKDLKPEDVTLKINQLLR